MKRSHLCLFILLFLLPTLAFSQTFMQSAGIGAINGKTKFTGPADYWPIMDFWGVSYFPRFNISEREQTAVSIGLPLVIGYGFGWGSDVNTFNYVIDLPLVVDYNFGHHATKNAKGIFGGYVGAGIGLTHDRAKTTSDTFGDYLSKQTSYGPLARAGLRFKIPLNVGELSFTLGGFYKIGLEKERYKLRGWNVMMNF